MASAAHVGSREDVFHAEVGSSVAHSRIARPRAAAPVRRPGLGSRASPSPWWPAAGLGWLTLVLTTVVVYLIAYLYLPGFVMTNVY